MNRKINDSFNEDTWAQYLDTQGSMLPPLPDQQQLTPRVLRVLAGNPGKFQLQGTNTYILGTGESRILIDTGQGMPVWIQRLSKLLQANKLKIEVVLLTHWHGDHTGGVTDLVSLYPELAHSVYKNQPDHGQTAIADQQLFTVEGASVRAIHTPGHSTDHMCFLLEEENALFTGDNVLGHGFTVVEDLTIFTSSLGIMESAGCAIGYPAHGIVIQDLPSRIKQYIEHDRKREKLILGALKRIKTRNAARGENPKGSVTVSELVIEIYGSVSEEISRLALQPYMIEVLKKLMEEKMVGFELTLDETRRKRWFVTRKAL